MSAHRIVSHAVAAAIICALAQAVGQPPLRAQPAPAAGADGQTALPQFRSGVARVTVEAVVVDDAGVPVRDLGPSDFHLEIDGKPRQLQSAELVTFGGDSTVPVGSDLAALPELSTNAARTPSRSVLIVVDRESLTTAESLRMRQAATAFIGRLRPADRLGLVSLPEGPSVDLTREHQRVAEALAAVTGTASERADAWPRVAFREAFDIDRRMADVLDAVVQRECRYSRLSETCPGDVRQRARQIVNQGTARSHGLLTGIAATVEGFGGVSGPKTLVLLSQGLPYGDRIPAEVGEIGRAAARASIAMYSVQMPLATASAAESGELPDLNADQRMLGDALWGFANASGGTVLAPTGRLDGAFDRIARELSASYLLTFDEESADRDGTSHRIGLKLARGSSRLVRYRREFNASPRDEPPGAAGGNETLAHLIDSGDVRSDLPIQVSTFTTPRADAVGQRTTVWAHVGATTATVIRLAIFDARHVRIADATEDVAPVGRTTQARGGLDHIVSASLPAGRYVVRVAARDAAGRLGSVEHAVDVRLAGTSELRVGSLMLLDERTVGHEVPTPMLSAGSAAALRVYVELESSSVDWSTVHATVETVDVATGGVRSTRPLAVLAADVPTRRAAQAVVPLAGWPRGTYLLRASVSRAGQPVATLVRGLVVDADTPRLAAAPVAPVTTVTPASGVTGPAAPVAVDEIVAMGTRFVDDQIERSAAVVAEERYVQMVRAGPAEPTQRNVDPALEWRADFSRVARGVRDAKVRRQMISDVLTVRTSDGEWTNYRDVAVVDGRKVGNRAKRALDLFMSGDKDIGASLRRIMDESSRHNLGLRNSFNAPMLPLQVLYSGFHRRFEFGGGGPDVVDGVPVVVVTYREVKTPTFIVARPSNTPLFIEGKLWIVPGDGRVLRSELVVREPASWLTATMVVDYRHIPELGLVMPVEMWERYVHDSPTKDYVERRARYSNYRRFEVSTNEAVTSR